MGRHPVMVRQVCPLIPFDLDQSPEVRAMAEFVWREDSDLELSFSLWPKAAEDCDELLNLSSSERRQAGGSARRMDNLWKHTCFETFLTTPGTRGYWEINASPNGDWNVYRFSDYRSGGIAEPQAEAPVVTIGRDGFGYRCSIAIQLKPWWQHPQPPELALSMVLEDRSGSLSYWALTHPGNEPDFHDRRSFLRC